MNVLSFDVESNGLHGEAFAVAGIVMDGRGHISSQFVGRAPIVGPVDPWVRDNVLGPMTAVAETAADGRALRDQFWAWYVKAKAHADLIIAANPYPVEARFLIACQQDDLPAREFEHPFPYFDLSSMLLALGIGTPAARHEFVERAVGDASGEPHNPLWDATATALAVHRVITMTPSVMSQPPAPQSL